MREKILDGFELQSCSDKHVALKNHRDFVYVLEAVQHLECTFRVRLVGPDRAEPLNSFFTDNSNFRSIASFSSSGTKASTTGSAGDKTATVTHGFVVATLDWKNAPVLTIIDSKTGFILHQDLPHRSYNLTLTGFKTYSRLVRKDVHFGLGEVAAPINLTGRKFEIRTSDSASYDSFVTDPLYKHTPFLVRIPRPVAVSDMHAKKTPSGPLPCTGYYSASVSDSTWDVGKSIDEPWGAYKTFEVDNGGLDNFIFAGHGLQDVSATLMALLGREVANVPPRWSLGYLASSMGIAESDDPPAQELMEAWLDKLDEHDIPCSAMFLSSGYTVTKTAAGISRNVFTMNTDRFPNFSGFCRKYHAKGLRVVPNIKPYLITDHPDYASVKAGGGLFNDTDSTEAERKSGAGLKPVTTRIWALGIGDTLTGSWCDTSSEAGFNWWKNGAATLVKLGVDGLWNDNDEYSLHEDEYEAAWNLPGLPGAASGSKKVGDVGRTTFTELLGRSSYEALVEQAKGRRPYILTRSANLNTMKYVCSTWSGDNFTSWRTLKGNIGQTINASLSGYHSYGSDIGGFAGPLPEPELFLRWCQINAYHPRFCIHSYKPNADDPSGAATVNQPWMYPEITDKIRGVIKRRYELVPYIYDLHCQGKVAGTPPVTWPGFGPFASDETVFEPRVLEGGDFWLGTGRIFVAGIFEAGIKSREVYLPKAAVDDRETYYGLFAPYAQYKAGSTATIQVSDELPVFVRGGSALPIGKPCATVTSDITRKTNDGTEIQLRDGSIELDDWRGVEIYPSTAAAGDSVTVEWTEDDGESVWPAPTTRIAVTFSADADSVKVVAKWSQKDYTPLWKSLWVILPFGDNRAVAGAQTQIKRPDGRLAYEILLQ